MKHCDMYFIYIYNLEVRLQLDDKWTNIYKWSSMRTGVGGGVHLAQSPNRDGLSSQTLNWSVPLRCFENKDLKLTASNRPSTMRHASLLTQQQAFPLESELFPLYRSECLRGSLGSCRLASLLGRKTKIYTGMYNRLRIPSWGVTMWALQRRPKTK
jgi:hypothetical protein